MVLAPGADASEADLVAHVKSAIASYKAPRAVEFIVELPKTSTGKIRKKELRDAEWGSATSKIKG